MAVFEQQNGSGNVLSGDQIETFRQFDTCTIANAMEKFQIRLRNEGYTPARPDLPDRRLSRGWIRGYMQGESGGPAGNRWILLAARIGGPLSTRYRSRASP
jgi:hypothetical protein